MVEIICEIGLNHNGNLDTALEMIDAASDAGCDFVKFQKRDVETVYTKAELDAPRESPWGTTNREQKMGLEFGWDEYNDIDTHCDRSKIAWFASPWDLNSLDFILHYSPPFIKVASAMNEDVKFLQAVKATRIPVILSTGMSGVHTIDNAIDIIDQYNIHCIMHCTSTYPTKTEELNLAVIPMLKERYPWAKIGFSNHHPGVIFMPLAVALGAEMIEFHFTLDKLSYGSDQAASINVEGMRKVVKYIRDTEKAMGDGIKKIYDSERVIAAKLRPRLIYPLDEILMGRMTG